MTNKTKTDSLRIEHFVSLPKFNFCKLFLLSLLLAVVIPSAYSQLKIYPLPRTTDQTPGKSKTANSAARTQELIPRALPFWDDFSTTPVDRPNNLLSNYPLDTLWVDSKSVWISSGLGLNPPSMNVATFNGLDADLLPYSDQILSNGFRDTLTSQAIKLGEVTAVERDGVYLSFFYQWSGDGEAPDANDYLRLEFKNDQEIWESVMTIRTVPSFTSDVFYDTLVKVEGDKFFHDGFQFRFVNYGRQSGPYDTWHVDYVYLNKNRSPSDRYLPDRTISSTLSSLFSNYRAIPYHHFLLDATAIENPQFNVFNVKNDTSTLSYSTEGIFINYKDSIPTTHIEPELGNAGPSPIDGLTGIIYQRERKTVTMEHTPEFNNVNQFNPESDYVDVSLKITLFTGDTFNAETGEYSNDYNPSIYKPLDFRSNDTIRSDYFLRNYYAYDDGFGEYTVALTAFGNRAAYLFEMLTEGPDTLVAFDIYLPDYGVSSNLVVEFAIYSDDNGVPGSVLYTVPSYTIKKNGLNNFQRIPLVPFLVDKKFYIGWKAPVGGILKIGLDTNNDSGEKLFVNTSGFWYQNTDIKGSVMIRPVFGGGDVIVGIPEEQVQNQVYPNPNQGEFFIPNTFDLLQVSSITGQPVSFKTQDQGENQKILLPNASPGLYILRIQLGNKMFSSKIMVR